MARSSHMHFQRFRRSCPLNTTRLLVQSRTVFLTIVKHAKINSKGCVVEHELCMITPYDPRPSCTHVVAPFSTAELSAHRTLLPPRAPIVRAWRRTIQLMDLHPPHSPAHRVNAESCELPLLSSEESPEVAILAIAVVTKGADHQHCHDGTADEGNKAGSGDYKWDSNRETDAAYGKGRDERRQMWQARQEVFAFSRDGRQGRRERRRDYAWHEPPEGGQASECQADDLTQ